MKKIVLIPDSFKGTMSSMRVCTIMEKQIRAYEPEAKILSIPVADGGEGTVDSFLSAQNGQKVDVMVKGPFMEDRKATYGIIANRTAVVEMSECAGLPLVSGKRNPLKTTTYGVGQLIMHAAKHGCRTIIVGLGGSCTNDAGAGAAAATGIRFLNKAGDSFIPTGGTLKNIAQIDRSALCPEVAASTVIGMCDVDNPLYGPTGAAYVFGRQKGGTDETIPLLDAGLRMFAKTVYDSFGVEIANIPGAGAAGGMGGGMVAFWNARLQSGIQTVLDTVKFDTLAQDADLILTGEGRLDGQSLRGKVVAGVAKRAQKLHVPVVAIVGDIGDGIEAIYDMGVTGIFSINRVAMDFDRMQSRSPQDLTLTVDNLFRFIRGFLKN